MLWVDSLRRLGSTLSLLLLVVLSFHQAAARPTAPRRDDSKRHTVVVRHYTLNVTDGILFQACAPFGPTSIVNSSDPGPTLRARAGDILQVRVWNHMSSGANLTMHFHGLSMRQHPVMDGTLMVSQWPITTGKFFDYRIPLTAEEKGTYFYHSHVGVQAMTAYGVLIVEDPEEEMFDPSTADDKRGEVEFVDVDGSAGLDAGGGSGGNSPYAYDADRVVAVGDWWDYSSPGRVERQLSADPFIWPGSASRLLVNGLSSPEAAGAEACNQTAADALGVSCSAAPAGCQTAATYPEIHVDYDTTYRLRFVGATSLMYVSLAILKPSATPYRGRVPDDAMERLTLIEADGTYLDALDVRHVEITTGQRYSALYRSRTVQQVAEDGTGGIYWMRLESRWRAGPSMWVKLVYPNATTADAAPPIDTSADEGGEVQLLPGETFGWVTSQLSPLSVRDGAKWWYSERMPGDEEVTRTVVLDAQQVKFYPSRKGVRWAEDGQVYNESDLSTSQPYLVRTFLGDVTFPTAAQFETALYSPTSYSTKSSGATKEQSIIAGGKAEWEAARRRHWSQGYDAALNMYFARTHEVIDIVIVNKPSELSNSVEIHPWHMHSKKHWSRTIQPGTFSFLRLQHLYNDSSTVEFQRPIQRDTTMVYASPGAAYLNATVSNPTVEDGGFSVLRYKVSAHDAGIFLLHCHIHFHIYMGMATVWTIAPDQLANQTGIYWPTNTDQKPNVQGLNESYFTYDENVAAIA